jgi:hypothetical protein
MTSRGRRAKSKSGKRQRRPATKGLDLRGLDRVKTFDATLERLTTRRKRSVPGAQEELFSPTLKMRAYLLTARKLFAANRTFSQRSAALDADVHEDVVSRWHLVPGFDAWFDAEMWGEGDRQLGLAYVACVRRAIRTGDPKELEVIMRLRGKLPAGYAPVTPGELVTAGPAMVLNLLIPRPTPPSVGQP